MAKFMNTKVASHLLSDEPILSLSVKITDSVIYQVKGNLKTHALKTEQWIAIKLLHKGAAETPTQLAKLMGISSPRVTRLIDQLEAKGLLSRDLTTEDRRKFTISLTEKGLKIAQRAVNVASIIPLLDESSLTRKEKLLMECLREVR